MRDLPSLIHNSTSRTSDHLVKVNSTLSLSASTLLHRLVLLSVCLIHLMSGRYGTNWTGKVYPARKFKCRTAARDSGVRGGAAPPPPPSTGALLRGKGGAPIGEALLILHLLAFPFLRPGTVAFLGGQ